jgi:hypothetical protein
MRTVTASAEGGSCFGIRMGTMVSLHYKGRIHKGKFSLRSLRYIVSDQAARLVPPLQRRWLLPVEARAIGEAAVADVPLSSVRVVSPLPSHFQTLGVGQEPPLQLTDHIYTVRDVTVTGWAGAMIQDGLLLTIRPQHNWVSSLRAHPHRTRTLPGDRPYFNLMAPIPARGHIFHWLFNSIVPLLAYLEQGGRDPDLGLIVNADQAEIQKLTIAFLKERYGLRAIETVGKHEAVAVPTLQADIPVPYAPRALQSPAGLARLDDLASFIDRTPLAPAPARVYVSRNDARLRRVSNEAALRGTLKTYGFEPVELARLSIAQQVRLFRNAEAVAGPHGAGLAHIAWCRPRTKIVEFFPDPGTRGKVKNASFDYWLISEARGLDYRGFLAGPVENRLDRFAIPETILMDAMDKAGL